MYAKVKARMEEIEGSGHLAASGPLPERLPDADDEVFLEVALAALSNCLVTGNSKRFPRGKCCGMKIVTPAEFSRRYRKHIA